MCGISGIINRTDKKVPKEEIKKINDLIFHRGPDDEGYYFGRNFAFGHRRLAILDLSELAHQPMEYRGENGEYIITYNGEVYNYLEIREELLKEGYSFKSNSDTEVILASYDKWGEKCVDKFNGMWAFAIYDKTKEIIFCSRDRFGIKPFYYMEIDGRFVFGSEIKQLLNFLEENIVNRDILIDYIVTSIQEHNSKTFFENIYKLESSHNLIYNLKDHTYNIKKYYEIPFYQNSEELSESIYNYEKEFERSIDYRLRSDVKVGTCLSGGLDSSTVATISSKKYQEKTDQKFIAIHAKSMEKDTDESAYAKKVSDILDIDLNIVEPDIDDFKSYLEEVVYTQEEPFGSPSIFMQYFVMKRAHELGCKVMLDGQGGDETLLGYEKYFPSAYIDILKKGGLLKALKQVKKSNKNNSKMSIDWIIKYTIGSLFPSLRKRVYKKKTAFMKKYDNEFSFFDELAKKYFNVNALQEYEIKYTNLPILLRYEDKNSMRHSVEARLPFIDYRTLEYALNIDISYKIKDGWTKYILRRVLNRYLPNEVVWRKNKLGFNAPENIWLHEISPVIKDTISNSKILDELCNMKELLNKLDTMDNRLKWRLFNVGVWERVYDVKIK
jgi:asparagine synthase (glutamine-hydrolysing)